jgi:hypothetical protein
MSGTQKSREDAEIEEIMGEIETLQKEMRPVATPAAKPAAANVHVMTQKASSSDPVLSADEEEDILKEFRAGATGGDSDGGLEDTLADLKADDVPQGKSILDEAISQDSSDSEEIEEREAEHQHDEVEAQAEENDSHSSDHEQEEEPMAYDDDNHEQNDEQNGTLSMTLNGNMTLKLKYATGDQEVSIGFGGGALTVKLADGTEFKIPVRKTQRNLRRVG